MTITTSSEQRFSQSLQKVLKGISAPISTSGAIDLDTEPIITLKESGSSYTIKPATNDPSVKYTYCGGTSKLPRQEEMLKELMEQMPRASFGLGNETKHDLSVRDALQMKAEDFSVNIPDEKLETIMNDIKKGLHLETDIMLEPYSLNVYKKGGKFVKHKDTPRGDDMLGTLVVCLPSLFRGGDFEVSMGNEKHTFLVQKKSYIDETNGGPYKWWNDSPETSCKHMPWCAFFADVDHEIKTVTGGVRITLAYLIRRKDSKSASSHLPREIQEDEQARIIKDTIENALKDGKFMEDGGKIGFPCMHLYTNSEVFPGKKDSHDELTKKQINKLKGRDLLVANAAASCSLKVFLVPYLSHSCQGDDSDFRLKKFPKKKRIPQYMSDEDIGSLFDGWRENESDAFDEQNLPENQADLWILEYDDPEQAELSVGSCDNYNYEGYYGNEAGYTSFYVKAALHIEVPESFMRDVDVSVSTDSDGSCDDTVQESKRLKTE